MSATKHRHIWRSLVPNDKTRWDSGPAMTTTVMVQLGVEPAQMSFSSCSGSRLLTQQESELIPPTTHVDILGLQSVQPHKAPSVLIDNGLSSFQTSPAVLDMFRRTCIVDVRAIYESVLLTSPTHFLSVAFVTPRPIATPVGAFLIVVHFDVDQ